MTVANSVATSNYSKLVQHWRQTEKIPLVPIAQPLAAAQGLEQPPVHLGIRSASADFESALHDFSHSYILTVQRRP